MSSLARSSAGPWRQLSLLQRLHWSLPYTMASYFSPALLLRHEPEPTMSIFLAGCGAHGFGQEEPKLRLLLLITTTEQMCLLPNTKHATPWLSTPYSGWCYRIIVFKTVFYIPLWKKKVPPHPQYPGWDLLAGSRINYRLQVVTEDRSCVSISQALQMAQAD